MPDPVRIAVLQMASGIDPLANVKTLNAAIAEAKTGGAAMLFTPEMSGLLDSNRARATPHIVAENANPVLAAVREAAASHGLWVQLGSLAILREDGKWANRGFLIAPDGHIAARYDKIHLFDVDLASGESWRESAAYAPGDTVVVADGTPLGRLGLAICYDLRFPALFRAFAEAKVDAIAIPAAFTVPTGQAHWHVLQRARAIEATAFVIAAAQGGVHQDGRETYGHSLVVDPWGQVLADARAANGVMLVDVDRARIGEVRTQLPVLANARAIAGGRVL